MDCCKLCFKQLSYFNQNEVVYSLCSNFLCKNIIINIRKESVAVEEYVYNIITYGSLTPQLRICTSIIIYAPQLFKYSEKSIVSEISSAYLKSTKQFITLYLFKDVIQKLRTELSLSKNSEDYFFQNIFNQLLLRLDIYDMFLVEYLSTFKCIKCNKSFTKSVKGDAILFPYIPQAFPKFTKNKMYYPVICLKCNESVNVELEFLKSGNVLSMMFKNGLSKTINFHNDLDIDPVVILEICDAQYKEYSLWIKLQNDKLWLCQKSHSGLFLKLVSQPEINPSMVRLIIFESNLDYGISDNSANLDSGYGSVSVADSMELSTSENKDDCSRLQIMKSNIPVYEINDLIAKKRKILINNNK